MADKKISALTGATTPLAGTEVLPIVQGGSTVKVAVSDLTTGRAVATAGGSFTDNITQSTAAKGVNFTANTPAAGMTSQLLNWYEQGTWTPTNSGGLTLNTCTYSRIGRLVTCFFNFVTVNATTGDMGGLPFATGAGLAGAGIVGYHNENATETWSINVDAGGTAWNFRLGSLQKQLSAGKACIGYVQYSV